MTRETLVSNSIEETIEHFTKNSVRLIKGQIKEYNNQPFPFIATVFALNDDDEATVAVTSAHNLVLELDTNDVEVGSKLRVGLHFLKAFTNVLAEAYVDHTMAALGLPTNHRETAIHGIMCQLLERALHDMNNDFIDD